jgi:UDP-glucose 4-epimerase
VRAGRATIPIGAGTWLWTRCYVGDVAAAVLAALGNPRAAGEIINIGEPAVRSIRGWAEDILTAAGHACELVRVPDGVLPEDLAITRAVAQHVVFDGYKAADLLGWRPVDITRSLRRSVEWHLSHPPEDPDNDFGPDDMAVAAAETGTRPR